MILSAIYGTILLFFAFGILKLEKPKKKEPKNLSVIIAAKNEEKNLPDLIEKLKKQNYPNKNFEIIFVNDRSTDNTEAIIKRNLKSFRKASYIKIEKENHNLCGKKNAINEAIKIAENDILVFTDADCLPPKTWLSQINNHYDEQTDFVAGYTPIVDPQTHREKYFKNIERIGFSSLAAGAFGWQWGVTCSAGNLSYRKTLFEKVNGFEGIGHVRSGDDDLLMYKMTKQLRKKNYMLRKESVNPTLGNENLQEELNRETRRSSKWRLYPKRLKILTAFLFIYYIYFIYLFFNALLGKIPWNYFLCHLLIKTSAEFLMYSIFCIKIKNKKMILLYPLGAVYYIPYFIFFGIKGTFGKYKWK